MQWHEVDLLNGEVCLCNFTVQVKDVIFILVLYFHVFLSLCLQSMCSLIQEINPKPQESRYIKMAQKIIQSADCEGQYKMRSCLVEIITFVHLSLLQQSDQEVRGN